MEIISKYFPGLSPEQLWQFHQLQESIIYWNQRINLISRKDIDHLPERHILHSLAIASHVQFNPEDTVLDVGTGGGFPGIPLSVFFPDVQFTLIDSIGKKVHAVRQIIRSLKLENASCHQVRAENYWLKSRYIVCRAVTDLVKFAGWVKGKIEPPSAASPGNGVYYLKGGDLAEELSSFGNVTVHSLKEIIEFKLKTINRLQRGLEPKPKKRTSKAEVVEHVLRIAGRPLHISEIIQMADRDFQVKLERDSIVSILIKKIKAGQSFIRTAPNTFALKE